jgi:hypothetical protein
MNDIVQRLRAERMTQCGHGDYRMLPENPDGPEAADLIESQAAEIETLKAELKVRGLAYITAQGQAWDNHERAEAAEAEVVRLREALKQIADIDADQDDYKLAYEDVQEIAYDAIKPAPGVKP